MNGKTALVTGAASGIGRATALALAERGADLFLCDLDEPGLAETEAAVSELGRQALCRRVDVADADAMRAFAETVHARVPAVDLLVNNAGVVIGGGLLDTPLDDWDWILGINLRGVIHGCHFFAPAMVTRAAGGHIVNLSSVAGYLGVEVLAAYSTTKFGVFGLSEALRDELAHHDIGVTAVCPGIIDTPIIRNARLRGPMLEGPEAREGIVAAYQRRNYTPERVAAAILEAVAKNRAVAPVSLEAWAAWYLKRAAPWLLRWVNARAGERRRRQLGLD